MARKLAALVALILICVTLALYLRPKTGPADAVVLIIRHAEKPEVGNGLSPRGFRRADAYPEYFRRFPTPEKPLALDTLFAATDSSESHRPRLTVLPLSKATGLPIDTRFDNKSTSKLARELRATQQGKHVLVCWHQGEIPALIRALGGNPDQYLPKGNWPDEAFAWVIQLTFDHQGQLILAESHRFDEGLLPGDSR
jgi:broad specificity phosphatase PhoE